MLVSCVLCTHDNRSFLPVAIASYLSQDYGEKELVVIDDSAESVRDLFEDIPNCTYFYSPYAAKNLSIKRNLAARLSRGMILVHFDSDDWSAPSRVRHQVENLLEYQEADVCGYHTAYCWDETEQRALYYHGLDDYTWGPCLCYYKAFALKHPWDEGVHFGEDGRFLKPATILSIDGSGQIVVRRHEKNAYNPLTLGFAREAKAAGLGYWEALPKEDLPAGFRSLIDARN